MLKKEIEPQRGFFPQPLYLLGTNKENKKANFSIISWITFASVTPPEILIACRGHKLTKKLIEANGVFSANLVTKDMLKMTDYFGTHSGYNEDKCEKTDVKYYLSKKLKVPIIDKSPYVFECQVKKQIKNGEVSIYIAKIVSIYVDNQIVDSNYGKIDMLKINPLVYAPGAYYDLKSLVAEVGKVEDCDNL